MPIPRPGVGPVDAQAHPDELQWRLVGDFRDGRYEDGSAVRIADLAASYGVSGSKLQPVIRFLEVIGHLVRVDDRTVVVTRPTVEDWADSIRVLGGFLILTVREAFPVLTPDDRAKLRALLERTRRHGALRDHGYTDSWFALDRFFAESTPNRLLRQLTLENLLRVANALTPAPPFEQWDTDGILLRIRDAALDDDTAASTEAAVEAVSDLRPVLERHIRAVRAKMEA